MNQASKEVVDQITASFVMPSVGMTLTQEEADAIKEYVRIRIKENIQGEVHGGFVRRESEAA